MTAKNILSPRLSFASASAHEVNTDLATAYRMKEIDAETPIIEVLQHFADCTNIVLPVSENGQIIGYIDSQSLIEGLCKTIVARDDSSIINLKCSHHDYSASAIAMAVEDADAHLVDMFSSPSDDEKRRDRHAACGVRERWRCNAVCDRAEARASDAALRRRNPG